MLHNPHVVPPTKADWEVGPLYPTRNIPYQYASLWDHPKFPRRPEPQKVECNRVPRDLRNRLKKAHGARSLLESLEREVREFVLGPDAEEESQDDGESVTSYEDSVHDDSEEEIVFVSKREKVRAPREAAPMQKVLFESLAEDQSAGFGFVSLREGRGWDNC